MMNTDRMLHFEGMGLEKMAGLFSQSQTLKSISANIYDSMEMALLRTQITEAIEKSYDIGEVTEVYEIFGGYVNRSFGIYTLKDGVQKEYFVRKYKSDITEKEILFEHKLIDFSIINGLYMAAGLIRTKNNKTYIKVQREVTEYYAIYEYLQGEDKYTWDNPNCNDAEYASSAEVLALVHNSTRHFDPEGLERMEPKIMEFLPTRVPVFKEFAARELDTKYHKYYLKNIDAILAVVESSQIPESIWRQMPLNPCHNDFHPGNLKYLNNKAVGIFDFDWSKIDIRLFDVCLAIAYFCSSWDGETDGVLRLDKCAIFLEAYQQKLKILGGLPPLTGMEKEYFPTMMAAANVYLLNWDITAYYQGSDLNEYEYIAYLSHNVRLMKWIESHKAEIGKMIQNV
ncbi:phosphotransferase [Sporomusa acidovorans]|uniref:Homoserine kinase n=1 Tax=Sporomusa acidovorans (strain ATCC 49682 / DSM 3132 / Mol) TaxID=1123286 RepID=A0ABZ3J799_SPOA4|nr:phosphotransferase [Sporomusa acidovorans]OZC21221.1 homoserine kinase [Sporomusa acidovorans DSM 3132]SDE65189.1 homoserine kinase type II [Sporomusa acidovorans]